VALSRCRTLEGLVLSSKISNQAIICDREVSSFNRQVEANQPDEQKLKLAKYTYQLELVKELFSFKQLAYWFERLEKILWENIKSYQGNLKDLVVDIQKVNIPELNKVSQKFALQIQTLVETQADVEQNCICKSALKKLLIIFIIIWKKE